MLGLSMNGAPSIQRVAGWRKVSRRGRVALWLRFGLCLAAAGLVTFAMRVRAQPPAAVSVSEARAVTNAATRRSNVWEGPTMGPRAQTGKTISLVVEDLRNGGILGVA